jgi:hypothetical protein
MEAYKWSTREEVQQGSEYKQKIIINSDDIIQFGIDNKILRRRDGDIKKFLKEYYIVTSERKRFNIHDYDFKSLKETLKDKCKVNKHKIEEWKKTKYGMQPRTAIDWTYNIIAE